MAAQVDGGVVRRGPAPPGLLPALGVIGGGKLQGPSAHSSAQQVAAAYNAARLQHDGVGGSGKKTTLPHVDLFWIQRVWFGESVDFLNV